VRLYGIDALEHKPDFGTVARRYAGTLAHGKQVTVEEHGTDRYGRCVGVVLLPDGTNLNHELVRAGMALWYRKYAPNDETLAPWRMKLEAQGGACGYK
jgi:micrococcal nuclease